jgi:hypothetical protein
MTNVEIRMTNEVRSPNDERRVTRNLRRLLPFACCLLPLLLCLVAGCGNVYLRGDAATAAETSALHAFEAVQRADADANTPGWEKAYLTENYKQWRFFVQSARKDLTWGPKLPAESAVKRGG